MSPRFGEGHLGGPVNWQRRRHAMDEPREAKILDDDGVDPGRGDGIDVIDCGGKFVGEDQGIESEKAFNVVAVKVIDDFRQLFNREIRGAMTGVEVAQAEIDGIGPVDDGGAHRIPIAGGGEQASGSVIGSQRGRRA